MSVWEMKTEGIVVKLGGSLMDQAERILAELSSSGRTVLIVPGGGMFADDVRRLGVDGDAAHWMAIAGMEQYGWYLTMFGIAATDKLVMADQEIRVLLPYRVFRDCDPLPHSWSVTSDSLAAWVAGTLGVPLVLLKSVDGIPGDDGVRKFVTESVDTDVIDSCCLPVLTAMHTQGKIINGRIPNRLAAYLRGEEVCGTILSSSQRPHVYNSGTPII